MARIASFPMKQMIMQHKYLSILFIIGVFTFSCQSKKDDPVKSQTTVHWDKLGPGGGGATFIPTFAYGKPEEFTVRCDMTGSYITHNGGEAFDQGNFSNGASS